MEATAVFKAFMASAEQAWARQHAAPPEFQAGRGQGTWGEPGGQVVHRSPEQ